MTMVMTFGKLPFALTAHPPHPPAPPQRPSYTHISRLAHNERTQAQIDIKFIS